MDEEKLLVVGLDGADRKAILNCINQSKTPEMKRLASEGMISTLKSPLPPITPVSMSSMLSGEGPEKHGVNGFESDGEEVNYRSIRCDTVFEAFEERDAEIIPVNVPMTSPLPDSVSKGVEGFPASGSEIARPYPVRERLREMEYSVEPSEFEDLESFTDEVFELAEKRFEIARELVQQDWDAFFLMFTGDARLQHYVDDKEVLEEFYSRVDDYIRKVKDELDEDVRTVIVSDHGFTKLETRFDLAEWLFQQGYMEERINRSEKTLYGRLEAPGEATAVPSGAYMPGIKAEEAVVDEIVEKLKGLEHDGRKVFREVIRTDDRDIDILPVPRRGVCHVAGYSQEVFSSEFDEKKVPDREGVIIGDLELEDPRSEDVYELIMEAAQ